MRFGFGRSEAIVSPLKSDPVPEAGDTRLTRARRGDNAVEINGVSHVPRITEGLEATLRVAVWCWVLLVDPGVFWASDPAVRPGCWVY